MEKENLEKLILNSKKYPPIAANVDDLIIIIEEMSKYNREVIVISYVGDEKIPYNIMRRIDKRKLQLIISNPLVLDEKFCENLMGNQNLYINIDGDHYENYNLQDIQDINKKINDILERIPKDATELEKAIYIYTIVTQIHFDNNGTPGNNSFNERARQIDRSLKGCILENKGVCYGYALTYYILAKQLGLECNIIRGKLIDCDDTKEWHTWNQVKINEKWYNLDATLDRKEISETGIRFFLLEDEVFNQFREDIKKVIKLEEFLDKTTGKVNVDGYCLYRESNMYSQESNKFHILQMKIHKVIERIRNNINKVFRRKEKELPESTDKEVEEKGYSWSLTSRELEEYRKELMKPKDSSPKEIDEPRENSREEKP